MLRQDIHMGIDDSQTIVHQKGVDKETRRA